MTTTARVVVATAEDTGGMCDYCGDPIERGEAVAILVGGARVHYDGCYDAQLAENQPEAPW